VKTNVAVIAVLGLADWGGSRWRGDKIAFKIPIRPMKISSRGLPMSSGAVAEGDENNASL